jgi:lipoate-protein ligase A
VGDGYSLTRSRSSASEFHARTVPHPPRPEIWWHEVTSPALVLGSTQDDGIADAEACAAAGVEVVRRRSGGGAVLLIPGEVTWIDVIVPRDAAGWGSDIHLPMRWLGHRLVDALTQLLPAGAPASVNDGAMTSTPWSSVVCFDGVGPGEVVLDGAKLVGISQRRTRDAARLQCCWYSTYDPGRLVALLDAAHRPPLAELAPVATVPAGTADALVELLAARLA